MSKDKIYTDDYFKAELSNTLSETYTHEGLERMLELSRKEWEQIVLQAIEQQKNQEAEASTD